MLGEDQPGQDAKTIIGVLASHDSVEKNSALAGILNFGASDPEVSERLRRFRFLFTGGTFGRLFLDRPVSGSEADERSLALTPETRDFLRRECGVIRLPGSSAGGVTILAHLLTTRRVSLLWPFLTPLTSHLLVPENLALLRLADQWRAKKLMNTGSVAEWLRVEAPRDAQLNPQSLPLHLELPGSGLSEKTELDKSLNWVLSPPPKSMVEEDDLGLNSTASAFEKKKTIVALISHDEMKTRMLDFVVDYERDLSEFGAILTTGTTGKLVQDAAPLLSRLIYRYHSGPKGGDIEIATEILYGGCQVVIFFVDPLRPHPHTDDIRVIFGACMIQDHVRMLSNEVQARDWMDRVVRGT
ncbi:MAG: methylglyoxal synthase [Thermoanaerobaculia bacterium]